MHGVSNFINFLLGSFEHAPLHCRLGREVLSCNLLELVGYSLACCNTALSGDVLDSKGSLADHQLSEGIT